jgi:serine/threonine protein kinase
MFIYILCTFNSLHRDLKYENILFVDESPLAEIKLIDFGLSKQFFESEKELSDGVGTMYVVTNLPFVVLSLCL